MARSQLNHVAVIVPGFGVDNQDWCIPAVSTWVRLLSEEARVEVFCLQYPYRRGDWTAFGAQVHGFHVPGRLGGIRSVLPVVAALRDRHRRDPFDKVVGVWAEESGLTAVLAGRLLHVPSQVIVAGIELATAAEVSHHRPWRRQLAVGVLQAADEVIAPSRWMAAKIPVSCQVVPWRVDPHLFRRVGCAPRGQRLLCVASLVPSKGVMDLLAAVELVQRTYPHVSLDIVGEGPQRSQLERRARHIPHISFRGAVPYLEMPDLYRQFNILVHPSRWEAQGMVMDEALAIGLRVVATRVGRGLDLSEAEGIGVGVGDIRGLADALLVVLGEVGGG